MACFVVVSVGALLILPGFVGDSADRWRNGFMLVLAILTMVRAAVLLLKK
jgi:hypothetical protein